MWCVLHAGFVTFHAPMALADFSDVGTAKQHLTCASFARMICRKNCTVFTFPMNVWTTGEVAGRLIGGNLSCVCAFVLTSFWTEPDEPFLLFIEEVNEPLYRDVYKRQDESSAYLALHSPIIRSLDEVTASSVSYTHLDVYKRQMGSGWLLIQGHEHKSINRCNHR